MNPAAMLELVRHRTEMLTTFRRYRVRRLCLFGSAWSPSWEPGNSDFDIIVEYGPQPAGNDLFGRQFDMQLEMERLFRRSVDLVERRAIRNELFRDKVNQEAQELYATR
jgi:predicted nucleotidyltransferase